MSLFQDSSRAWESRSSCTSSQRRFFFGTSVCLQAAKKGHLHVLQWLREIEGPWDSFGCILCAARNGHVHILQWLREFVRPLDKSTFGNHCDEAAANGHLHVLQWLLDNGFRQWTPIHAALLRSTDILMYWFGYDVMVSHGTVRHS